MKPSRIVYDNLRAEMGRENLGLCEMANALNCNRDTLRRKLTGRTQINLDEAFAIQMEFFPGMTLEYLFARDDRSA